MAKKISKAKKPEFHTNILPIHTRTNTHVSKKLFLYDLDKIAESLEFKSHVIENPEYLGEFVAKIEAQALHLGLTQYELIDLVSEKIPDLFKPKIMKNKREFKRIKKLSKRERPSEENIRILIELIKELEYISPNDSENTRNYLSSKLEYPKDLKILEEIKAYFSLGHILEVKGDRVKAADYYFKVKSQSGYYLCGKIYYELGIELQKKGNQENSKIAFLNAFNSLKHTISNGFEKSEAEILPMLRYSRKQADI